MEEYTQITLGEWTTWKEDIRKKLNEIAGSFVYIGYRLKQIRESEMFDGAADIFEFAQNEYGLGKSTVSRFIAINEKYSEGGNSLELKEEYKNYSSSKLSEMLSLSDSECELITEKTTIKDIREIKRFHQQDAPETKETPEDIENALTVQRTPLENCIIDFFSKNKERLLEKVLKLLNQETPAYKEAAELLNPSGQGSYKKGIVFLFFYDWNMGVKYKLLTQPQPISMTWPEYLNEIYKIYATFDQENVWNAFYGANIDEIQTEKEPENQQEEKAPQTESNQGIEPSVATSQQVEKLQVNVEEKEEEKNRTENTNLLVPETDEEKETLENVTKIAEIVEKEEKEEEQEEEQEEQEEEQEEQEEQDQEEQEEQKEQENQQIEGQKDITDYPEYLPKDYCVEGVTENKQSKAAVVGKLTDAISELIQKEIDKLINNVNANNWDQAIMDVEEITYKLQKAKEIEESSGEDE